MFQLLVMGSRPEMYMWDLEKSNRLPLVHAQCLKYLCCIASDLFLFYFGTSSTVRWKLGVTSAVDVLYVCRLDQQFDEYDLAHHLIQQGVRFYTLLPLKAIPCSPTLPDRMLPICLSGYMFTLKDYKAYQWQCNVIFSQP
jgi:hypothetical protein